MFSENFPHPAPDGPLDCAVLVLDACNTLSLAAAVDPMRAANRQAGHALFRWRFVTATGAAATLTSGLQVPGAALARLDRCDLLIVVAGFDLASQDTPALRSGLRRLARRGAALAGIDGGPWLLAEAGLLDGYAATTHWEDLERFATRFPAVDVLNARFHIDRSRLTCGGALPAIDMMLHLIGQRHGAQLAARVAGAFIHDSPAAPSRAQSHTTGDARHNRLTARASALMEQNLEMPLSIAAIAARCGTGTRSLQLQFRERLGLSPQAHYLALRLAEARRLVTDTDMALMDVALATGFASQSSFARAFRAAFGRSARMLRRNLSPLRADTPSQPDAPTGPHDPAPRG